MKILIYGMQSSGATAFAFLMAQREYVAILDLYCNELAPSLEGDVIMKCVVSKDFTIEDHIARFNPDVSILFTRDLGEVRSSLSKKKHKDRCGTMEEKISIYEDLDHSLFDITMNYNEIKKREINKVKFFIDQWAYETPRSLDEIIKYNNDNSEWCREWFEKKWRYGCFRGNRLFVDSVL